MLFPVAPHFQTPLIFSLQLFERTWRATCPFVFSFVFFLLSKSGKFIKKRDTLQEKGNSSKPSYAFSWCWTRSSLTLSCWGVDHLSMPNTKMNNCHNVLVESPNVRKYDQHMLLYFDMWHLFPYDKTSISTASESKSFLVLFSMPSLFLTSWGP